jgi:hypothetical protein
MLFCCAAARTGIEECVPSADSSAEIFQMGKKIEAGESLCVSAVHFLV